MRKQFKCKFNPLQIMAETISYKNGHRVTSGINVNRIKAELAKTAQECHEKN